MDQVISKETKFLAKLAEKIRANVKTLMILLILFMLSRLMISATSYLYSYFTGDYSKTWDMLMHFDSSWYLDIVNNGYQSIPGENGQANYAFYPLYPMTVKILDLMIPDTYTITMIGVYLSNVCTVIAAFFAVKLVRMFQGDKEGYFIGFLMFFAPHSMYFSMFYTEAMFAMFCTIFFYACYKKNFLLASVAAMFAAAARIVGAFLVFSLIIFMYQASFGNKITIKNIVQFVKDTLQAPKRLFEILLCPFGIFTYLFYLYRHVGDVWASANIQIAWHIPYHNAIKAIYESVVSPRSGASSQYWGIWAIVSLMLIAYLVYKEYYAEAVFGIFSLLAAFSTDVIASSRYIMGNIVIYVAIYILLVHKEYAKIVCSVVFVILQPILFYLWFMGDCVILC